MERVKVMLTIPNTGWIHFTVVKAMLGIYADSRLNISLLMPTKQPSEHNRNYIVTRFLDSDNQYLISIDSDNPPMSLMTDLVFEDKDIIGLSTTIWKLLAHQLGKYPLELNGYMYHEKTREIEGEIVKGHKQNTDATGIKEVDAIGTGCFIVARRVFEHPEMQKGCFLRSYDEKGIPILGSDLAFCKKAKESGFKIWCSYDHVCVHIKEMSLREMAHGFGSWADPPKQKE